MNLLRFDSVEVWTRTLTGLVRERVGRGPGVRVCLPTGHTPNPLYHELGKGRRTPFSGAKLFALDEFGGLPASDPGTCRNMLLDNLKGGLEGAELDCLNAQAGDLEAECARYQAAVGVLDLTLLGVGMNGHLGLNEPGSAIDSDARRVELHAATIEASARYTPNPNLPKWGLTLGLRQILSSKEVWVLATGAKKAPIIRQMMYGPITTDLPASLLRDHPNAWLCVDAQAGSML